MSRPTLRRAVPVILLAALLAAAPRPASAADAVTEWSLLADSVANGSANWHTLAIMHQAMHDARNAAQPAYARWFPPTPDEPSAAGADPDAAMAAAAHRVMATEHPQSLSAIEQAYQAALARIPDGPARQAGAALGDAVGAAALARRRNDGFRYVRPFPVEAADGRWRPTPPEFRNSYTTDTRPFLFTSDSDLDPQPPPEAGTPRFAEVAAEVRQLGALESSPRTKAQSEAAMYWAYQSSQRGYIHLAAALLDAHPRPGGLAAHARIMSQLAVGLADSAVLIWELKERFGFWRPVTVIRGGAPGVAQDMEWLSFVETPAHPEYPSGHASDCFTGSGVLAAAFPELQGPVAYVAQTGSPPEGPDANSMGQHAQYADSGLPARREFPTLQAMARNCADSRIWAGAHFRTANEESERVAGRIVARALAAVPAR